jgi:thioredoxin 1
MSDIKHAVELRDDNFIELAVNSTTPVLVDFWAEWCGPCRMLGPVIEELAKDYEGRATIGKVDVDNNPELAVKFGIRSIPTIILMKNGQVVDRIVGAMQKPALEQRMEPLFDDASSNTAEED